MIDSYLIRMEEEFSELDKKILKLNSFINNQDGLFNKLLEEDKDLLVAQLNAMYTYSMILKIRIDKGSL